VRVSTDSVGISGKWCTALGKQKVTVTGTTGNGTGTDGIKNATGGLPKGRDIERLISTSIFSDQSRLSRQAEPDLDVQASELQSRRQIPDIGINGVGRAGKRGQ